METTLVYSLVFGFIFTIAPSIAFSVMVGFSQRVFLGFFAAFSSIAVAYGLFPTWMLVVSVLAVAVLLYNTVKSQGGGGMA